MQIEEPTLEYLGASRVRISWTGTLAYFAWVFVNGILREGPISFDTEAREYVLNVPNPFRIEVHEAPEGVPIEPAIGMPLVRRPLVWFSPRALAARYNAYRRPRAGDPERVIASIPHDPAFTHYEIRPGEDMRQHGGVWNSLRVECVNARGNESVRPEFSFFVAGLPKPPISMTPSGGAGVFALQLGV
jgi:hypothetical protein